MHTVQSPTLKGCRQAAPCTALENILLIKTPIITKFCLWQRADAKQYLMLFGLRAAFLTIFTLL